VGWQRTFSILKWVLGGGLTVALIVGWAVRLYAVAPVIRDRVELEIDNRTGKTTKERVERQQPVVEVAPAPLRDRTV